MRDSGQRGRRTRAEGMRHSEGKRPAFSFSPVLPESRPASLPAFLSCCLPVLLPSCPPARPPARLPACLPAFSPAISKPASLTPCIPAIHTNTYIPSREAKPPPPDRPLSPSLLILRTDSLLLVRAVPRKAGVASPPPCGKLTSPSSRARGREGGRERAELVQRESRGRAEGGRASERASEREIAFTARVRAHACDG
jgi:hypothetical protein